MADVEEADIYKLDRHRLFYLNTYRGFIIYDVADPKNPVRVSRLPVFGYPVEMFVEGNTVYALLRDVALPDPGERQAAVRAPQRLAAGDHRHHRLRQPAVLKTIDIIGQLREGVSRKIDNTIYVVSYSTRGYYWGWRQRRPDQQKEQAWVYSFNVADPRTRSRSGELQDLRGRQRQRQRRAPAPSLQPQLLRRRHLGHRPTR